MNTNEVIIEQETALITKMLGPFDNYEVDSVHISGKFIHAWITCISGSFSSGLIDYMHDIDYAVTHGAIQSSRQYISLRFTKLVKEVQ